MTNESMTSIQDSKHPETILICSIRVIGDVILTTPLVGILSEAYPHAAIDLMVAAGTGPFLRQDPRVRNIIEVSSKNVGANVPCAKISVSWAGYSSAMTWQ